MTPCPLTEKDVILRLFGRLSATSDIIIPRFTPKGWWECDVWRLTKNGFVDEFEIKLSVSDFRADANKERTGPWAEVDGQYVRGPAINKHELLAAGEKGPNRFWFVMPGDLAGKITLPEWAGLMVVNPSGRINLERPAPKRHKNKWEGDRARVLQTFYYRFWNMQLSRKGEFDPQIQPVET